MHEEYSFSFFEGGVCVCVCGLLLDHVVVLLAIIACMVLVMQQ